MNMIRIEAEDLDTGLIIPRRDVSIHPNEPIVMIRHEGLVKVKLYINDLLYHIQIAQGPGSVKIPVDVIRGAE
jgi:hypothetical protein